MVYRPIAVERVLGCLASRGASWKQAMEHFEAAISQLSTGGARWELAQSQLDYAEMRRRRRRRGDILKAEALELEAGRILQELAIAPPSQLTKHTNGTNLYGLTGREIEVLAIVSEGRRNQEIAETLTVSPRTVARHLQNILQKMGARSRTEAVMLGVAENLVGPFAERH